MPARKRNSGKPTAKKNPRLKKQAPPCGSVEARHSIVELGKTRISDLYGEPHGRPLIAVLDAGLRTAYVASGAESRARKIFHARKAKGNQWVLESSKSPGSYTVKPIEELDPNRPVRTTDVFAIEGYECILYKKGTCIDFIYKDGTFAYSWQATKDTGLCTRGGTDCQELHQANQVTLYPGKGCTGQPYQQNVDWMFCQPA